MLLSKQHPTSIRHRRAALWGLMAVIAAAGPVAACGQKSSSPPVNDRERAAQKDRADSSDLKSTKRSAPRSDEARQTRLDMVATQIASRGVKDSGVLEAMRNVPRHWFVPASLQSHAYRDRPLPIGEGQTISQPYIVALMTEALRLNRDSRVLEIGTGSGYQAAVLSEITPHVYTIEIVAPLAERAIAAFKRHGYDTIKTRIGDGYAGWPEHAPFDAIIVTCAPDHIPPKLIEQLKPGGRICIPVGAEGGIQKLIVVRKTADGQLDRHTLIPVRFVPMTGKAQEASSGD